MNITFGRTQEFKVGFKLFLPSPPQYVSMHVVSCGYFYDDNLEQTHKTPPPQKKIATWF